MYLEDINESELKPSLKKFSNRFIINWNKRRTKKLVSIASVRDYEAISLIPVVVKVLSMDAMILQSYFEPSLHNPGPGLWFSPHWKTLTLSLQSFLIHTINLQHLIVQDSQDIYSEAYNNLMESSHIPPKAFSSRANADEVSEWIKNSPSFPLVVNSALKVYRLCEILVSMKPASRGSQHDVFRQFLFLLSCHQKQHEMLRADTPKFSFHAMTTHVSWQEKVLLFGAQWEAERLILELPSNMANAADIFSTASTRNTRFVHVFYNLFAFMAPLFVFFKFYISSLLFLLFPWRWRWRMVSPWVFTRLPWYRDPKVAYCLRWIFGIALLFSIPLYCKDYRLWTISESTEMSPEKVNIVSLTTKMASWSILGFLASIQMTVEGTMYRSILRFSGMLLGSLCGYLCITIVGVDRKVPQILWLLITTFCVCWIGCNSENPFLGYNTSWGYACQFFIYQQAIIVLESYSGSQTVQELFLSRVVSQMLGISTAYLISCFIFPCQCHLLMVHATRQILFSANHLVHLQLLNTHILSKNAEDEDELEKSNSYRNQKIKTTNTLHRSLKSSVSKSKVSPKTIYGKENTSFHDSQSHFPFLPSLSNYKKEVSSEKFVKEFERYMNLMNEGVDELKLLSRELGNLESAALRKVNTNVYEGVTILKLIAVRQSILMSYFHYSSKIESEGFYFQLSQILEEIDKLLLYTEQLLTGKSGFSWFIGYRHLFWHIIPFMNTAPQLTVEWIPLEFLIQNILKKWNGLDIYFTIENKTEPVDPSKTNASQNLLLQYQMTYFVWAYMFDVFNYVSVVTQL